MAPQVRLVGLVVIASLVVAPACAGEEPRATSGPEDPPVTLVDLPPPIEAESSLHSALRDRRSVRVYRDVALDDDVVATLLWATQGQTQESGQGRTAPSAGGTYPLEVYVATAAGVQRYVPDGHRAERWSDADLRLVLHDASGGQDWVRDAPAVVVITAVTARTAERYGGRAERYVTLEAGHAAQNLLLAATALGLGAVPVGAFDDGAVAAVLGLPDGERALYIIPVGIPRE